ncbi:MAG TPA: EAL domain-containing response regulator [Holophagaceae bacterium]|jgi:EAL domain-containing protein (putative c-di-GMP-specific phosphodiesterase class I)/CheY-like chemotaxis protein|nr:EAL domain-containing response regulator [Holophagaceae bacterium]
MNLSELTTLVVEDQDLERRVIVKLLQSLGVGTVLDVASARQALGILMAADARPHVVFCDLEMPEMDGVEFISQLAEQRLVKAIVVASGMEASILNTVETMARAYGLEVLGTLEKPVTSEDLARVLDRFHLSGDPSGQHLAFSGLTGDYLRQALDRGEMLPFFQPKISFSTGKVEGAEALARWFRPGHGVVPPMSFVPILEAEGLVGHLTEVMLCQTCAYLRAWGERGLNLKVSVNVSMLDLNDLTVVDHLDQLVRDQGCDPHQLVLEVTETAVMAEATRALNVLARLRMKGFGLSIDDFGTGYSSLQQLSNLPCTELKIDQSFVRGAPEHARHRSIVESSLDLARRLNLKTVAEGVEGRAEWDLLKSMGCQEAQGYFIARPMPGHEIPGWAELWRPPED